MHGHAWRFQNANAVLMERLILTRLVDPNHHGDSTSAWCGDDESVTRPHDVRATPGRKQAASVALRSRLGTVKLLLRSGARADGLDEPHARIPLQEALKAADPENADVTVALHRRKANAMSRS